MSDWLNTDGPVFTWLDRLGQMILLSLAWLIGCIPVVTAGSATTALYYAVIKSVRRGRGDALKEFIRSFRENLRRSIPITLTALVLLGVMCLNIHICLERTQGDWSGMPIANAIGIALLVMVLVYVCPVLSRFQMRVRDVWKLSFVMAIRFLPYTILLAAGGAALAAVQIFVLPIPTVLILPSAWCFVTTFPMEKVLRTYMPEKKPEDDAWYYE